MSDLHEIRTRTVAGAAAGNITVTGINVGDKLITVINRAAAGANLESEFTITAANTINNTGGTSTAGAVLEVTWEAYQGGRWAAGGYSDNAGIGRSKF